MESREICMHGKVIYFRNDLIRLYKLNTQNKRKESTWRMKILISNGLPDVLVIKHE